MLFRSDFGRQQRQRDVIQAIINEGASISTVTKFDDILDILGNNVRTNLTFDEMVDIQANYKDARHDLSQHQVNGSGTRIDNIYYLIVAEEDRSNLSNLLKKHLELDSEVARNN